ncbi:tetratricopeptide repeat protein [bacterium]|nr:tetratricopeptide repeat protein [bacterium]QQR59817.1 MAG: tetratricopeptide repeat protein [Candidatus Melainabacteria bacterium]
MRTIALAVMAVTAISFSLNVTALNAKESDGRAGNWKKGAQGAPNLEKARKLVKDKPDSADAHNDLGWALRQNGKMKEAENELRKALELDDKIPYAHSNLSVVLLDTGRPDEAIKEGRRACAIDEKQAIYHVVLGNALAAKKDYEKAANEYNYALQLKPDYENALYNLGRILYDQGKRAEAGSVLGEALKLDPDDGRVLEILDKIVEK